MVKLFKTDEFQKLKDKYPNEIKEIIPGRKVKVPEIDFSRWPKDVAKRIEGYIPFLVRFVALPLIIDKFQNYKERQDFGNRLSRKDYLILKESALRCHPLSHMLEFMSFYFPENLDRVDTQALKEVLKQFSEIHKKVKTIEIYDQNSTEEKIKIVEETKSLLIRLFRILSEEVREKKAA